MSEKSADHSQSQTSSGGSPLVESVDNLRKRLANLFDDKVELASSRPKSPYKRMKTRTIVEPMDDMTLICLKQQEQYMELFHALDGKEREEKLFDYKKEIDDRKLALEERRMALEERRMALEEEKLQMEKRTRQKNEIIKLLMHLSPTKNDSDKAIREQAINKYLSMNQLEE